MNGHSEDFRFAPQGAGPMIIRRMAMNVRSARRRAASPQKEMRTAPDRRGDRYRPHR
ncbi:Hypothetical protein EPM1_0192 [Stenotrophomonas maltophilia EPM1]|nr:Hypothetical protein EPM1_0192 [Stenotrophomonas maltophilia EPM1]